MMNLPSHHCMSSPLLSPQPPFTSPLSLSELRARLKSSASGFLYVPLPAGLAGNITSEMNRAGASRLLPSTTRESVEQDVDRVYGQWMAEQWDEHAASSSSSSLQDTRAQVVLDAREERTMGYVTKDACPGVGDDIDHVPGTFPSPLPIPLDLSIIDQRRHS